MSDLTVSLRLPRDLLGVLDIPEKQLADQVLELVALELFRQGRISAGKGAGILAIFKWDFIQILARHQVAYFTESTAELEAEIAAAEALMERLPE